MNALNEGRHPRLVTSRWRVLITCRATPTEQSRARFVELLVRSFRSMHFTWFLRYTHRRETHMYLLLQSWCYFEVHVFCRHKICTKNQEVTLLLVVRKLTFNNILYFYFIALISNSPVCDSTIGHIYCHSSSLLRV